MSENRSEHRSENRMLPAFSWLLLIASVAASLWVLAWAIDHSNGFAGAAAVFLLLAAVILSSGGESK